MKQIIKEGDKYRRLTAIKFIEMRGIHGQFWLFKCDCGIEKIIRVDSVKSESIKSCGCLNSEVRKSGINGRTHGLRETKIYGIYAAMKSRCLDKNCKVYSRYGGRGIKICLEWLGENGFQNFYNDMGERPENKTLDRIKNNLGYCKSNCRWATPEEQANNTRTNVYLTYKDKTQTIAQWARELGMNYGTLHSRLRSKWSIEKALTLKI